MTEPKKLTPERLEEIAAYVETARHSRGGAAFSDRALPDLLAHIAALEQMATVKGALNYCVLANAERDAAIARAEAAEAEWDAAKETWDAIDRAMFFTVKKRAEAAEARVKALEAELRWQPIETAPKDGTVILMTDGVVVSAGHWKGPDPQWVEWRPNWIVAHFVHSSPVIINENVTHWMPLPALSPPATEDAKP